MKKEKKYQMGQRFYKYRNLGMGACFLVILGFYFLYDFLLTPVFPLIKGEPLLLAFALVEMIILCAIYRGAAFMVKRNYYFVDSEALWYVSGNKRCSYAWKDFESVEEAKFNFSAICPIQYQVAGKTLLLNQYLEDIWELHREILKNIESKVRVDEQIREQVMYMS